MIKPATPFDLVEFWSSLCSLLLCGEFFDCVPGIGRKKERRPEEGRLSFLWCARRSQVENAPEKSWFLFDWNGWCYVRNLSS